MQPGSLTLVTLTWLDRRRVLASPNRQTAAGRSSFRAHPSVAGGQASRPLHVLRHFTLSLPRPASALLVGGGALCAAALTARAGLRLAQTALHYVACRVDLALSLPTPHEGPAACDAGLALLSQPLEVGKEPLRFASALYSALGAMAALDGTPALLPAPRADARPPRGLCQAVALGSRPIGWVACPRPLGGLPLFRTYLGEWRRLADQASSGLTPAARGPLTGGAASAPRPRRRPAAAHARGAACPATPAAPAALARRPGPYALYLVSPWAL